MLNVLVVEDHPVTAEGMRAVLSRLPASVLIEPSVVEAKVSLGHSSCDLIVLDLSFKGCALTGFDLLRDVRLRGGPPVLVASMYDDPVLQEATRSAGARGFVSKMQTSNLLLQAARSICSGVDWFPGILPEQKLTSRQNEVVVNLAAGKCEKEIAAELGISLRSVELHIARAKKYTRARSLAQLARIVMERGYFLMSGVTRQRSTSARRGGSN